MRKKLIQYLGVLALSVAAALLLLLIAACIPQGPIDVHVAQSAEQLKKEGAYPILFDGSHTAILDNYTDALILSQSKAASISDPSSILLNPLFETGEDPVEDLYAYVHGEDPQPTSFYVRYWMGFRVIMRLCLYFLNHYQIRRYLAVVVLGLWTAAICSVSRNINTKAAFLFAMSVIFCRPQMVVMSPQFSCCFLIAFTAMLLVPRLYRKGRDFGMVFFEIGIVTMFLDFYTTPLLTFGLPFLYLYLLSHKDGKTLGWKALLKLAGAWLAGYVGMWFAKMLLTTLLTDVNGLENGLISMIYRLGIRKTPGTESAYSFWSALRAIWFAFYCDSTGKVVLVLAVATAVISVAVRFVRRKMRLGDLSRHAMVLAAAAIPILWMLAAPQPTSIHYWFQYRSTVVTFWGLGLYVLLTLEDKTPQKR